MSLKEGIDARVGREWHCHAEGCENGGIQYTSARLRKWCSDACRKAQYSRPCEVCGKPLTGCNGRGPNAPTRCPQCLGELTSARMTERFHEQREEIIQMYRDGVPLKEMAERLGWSSAIVVGAQLHRLRSYGYDFPHRRDEAEVERIREARWGDRSEET